VPGVGQARHRVPLNISLGGKGQAAVDPREKCETACTPVVTAPAVGMPKLDWPATCYRIGRPLPPAHTLCEV